MMEAQVARMQAPGYGSVKEEGRSCLYIVLLASTSTEVTEPEYPDYR